LGYDSKGGSRDWREENLVTKRTYGGFKKDPSSQERVWVEKEGIRRREEIDGRWGHLGTFRLGQGNRRYKETSQKKAT